jgi:hypothetical protein
MRHFYRCTALRPKRTLQRNPKSSPPDRPVYSSGTSMSPESIFSMTLCGGWPSIVHPTDCAVPRISFTVPARVLASERGRMIRAMLRISSKGMFPVCLMFFSFFLSRGGSERCGFSMSTRRSRKCKYDVPLRARMTKEDAEGTTATAACRFWMVS